MDQMDYTMSNNMTDNTMDSQPEMADGYIRDQVFLSMDEFVEQVSQPQDAQGEAAVDAAGDTEEIQDISEVQDWLGEINPNFDPYDDFDQYENNCGCCAYAVAQRLEGREDISAGPDNIGSEEGMSAITGHEIRETTSEEIELSLLEQGEGAHAIIGIDRVDGPGHWFNAYCADGENVYYVDGQDATISEWPPEGLGDVSRWVMEVKEAE